jgi:uncharacterized protein
MTYTKHTKGIIISYIIAQFASVIIYPFLLWRLPTHDDFSLIMISTTISFIIGLILTLGVIKDEWDQFKKGSLAQSLIYAVLGFVVTMIGQFLISSIFFYLDVGGLNTETEQDMVKISEHNLAFLVVPVLIGPILEEFVFRYAILGSLMKRMKTVYAVLLSSLLFSVMHLHFNLTNLAIYAFCGIVFSFIYIQTKNILTPIIAHVLMNAFVMLTLLL